MEKTVGMNIGKNMGMQHWKEDGKENGGMGNNIKKPRSFLFFKKCNMSENVERGQNPNCFGSSALRHSKQFWIEDPR